MSKVTNVLENNQDAQTCLVFYDKTSIDSIFGAAIIRYICEEITNVGESVVCKDIAKESDNILDFSYLNVSFIGCFHKDAFINKSYINEYKDKTLFVISNKADYTKVKSFGGSPSIEYSEEDSCALQLYKIAFGEFKDRIPQILQLISIGTMRQFDNENYYKALQLEIGFKKYFEEVGFDTFYQDIAVVLCNQLDGYNDFDYSSFVNTGKNISTYYNNYLIENSSVVKGDKFTFDGNKKSNVLLTNSMLDLSVDSIKEEYQNEYILALSRRDSYNWNAEFVFNGYSYNSYGISRTFVDKTDIQLNINSTLNTQIAIIPNPERITMGDPIVVSLENDSYNLFTLSYIPSEETPGIFARNYDNNQSFGFYSNIPVAYAYVLINTENLTSYAFSDLEYNAKLNISINNRTDKEVNLKIHRTDTNTYTSTHILSQDNIFLTGYSYTATQPTSCANYMKKYYKGEGIDNHAIATISNETFVKIMKTKKF